MHPVGTLQHQSRRVRLADESVRSHKNYEKKLVKFKVFVICELCRTTMIGDVLHDF